MLSVSPKKLAVALTDRFEPVVPADLEITTRGACIRLAMVGTPWWSELDLAWSLGGGPHDETLPLAVEQALDGFQDDIAEVTTEPWPATAPEPMPEPFAEIHDGALLAGFGDPSAPVLSLEPIPLGELEVNA